MTLAPGSYLRPRDDPDHWEVVQGVDDHGVFIGAGMHVAWPVLVSYWQYQERNSVEWQDFPLTAEALLRQLVLIIEAAWMGRYKPEKIQAVIDDAIPLAGLRKIDTTPGEPPGYLLR